MRRRLHNILIIIALGSLSLAGHSCVQPLEFRETTGPSIWFNLFIPVSETIPTKAGTGNVSATDAESTLYDVQVWAILHKDTPSDSDPVVGYSEASSINVLAPSREEPYRMTMTLPSSFLDMDPEKLKLDFYALANWRPISAEKPQAMTRGELENQMTFGPGGTLTTPSPASFGADDRTVNVPSFGLPFSAIYKGEDGKGFDVSYVVNSPSSEELIRKMPIIMLHRAVSRLRFIVVRPTGSAGMQITRIELDKNMIPDREFVFPKTMTVIGTGGTYETIALPGGVTYNAAASRIKSADTPLLTDSQIFEYANPLDLRSDSHPDMTAQQYYDYINGQVPDVVEGTAVASKITTYLRESDKALSGRIYYKWVESGEELSKPFSMELDPSVSGWNNFHRNHDWLVYAYFSDNDKELELTVRVLPWDKKYLSVNSAYQINIDSESRFKVDAQSAEVVQTGGGNYDVRILPDNTAKGYVVIYGPVGGQLLIQPAPGGTNPSAFRITPQTQDIDPAVNGGRIDIEVDRNPDAQGDLSGSAITLSFSVKLDGRTINADSELVDQVYRFVIP